MVRKLIIIPGENITKGKQKAGFTPRRKRFLTGLVMALCIGGVICIFSYFNLLSSLQLRTGDLLFLSEKISPGSPANNKIVIVGIDDKSLTQLGQFQSFYALRHRAIYTRLIYRRGNLAPCSN